MELAAAALVTPSDHGSTFNVGSRPSVADKEQAVHNDFLMLLAAAASSISDTRAVLAVEGGGLLASICGGPGAVAHLSGDVGRTDLSVPLTYNLLA
jgi:hypothetical protein